MTAFKGFARPVESTDNEYEDEDNICDEVTVKNNRHQLLLTLGYSF